MTILACALSGCPDDCVCMWKNGKETTECINRDRNSIPRGIEPSTQVLDLRGNNLRILSNKVLLTFTNNSSRSRNGNCRLKLTCLAISDFRGNVYYQLAKILLLLLSDKQCGTGRILQINQFSRPGPKRELDERGTLLS